MWYELWDGETGNLIGTYNTEAEALQAVRAEVGAYGRDSESVTSLALLRRKVRTVEGSTQPAKVVAEGAALIQRALPTAHSRQHVS